MRLLHTRTGRFTWIDDPRHTCYAILSHVWAKPSDLPYIPEQTYQDVLAIHAALSPSDLALPRLSAKIQRFCDTARGDGFDLAWVDTCCIDQSSSAELSEALNSMFGWYRYASACYAFLHDVADTDDERERREQFRGSRWFTRVWTLQELLAPSVVIFFSAEWSVVGSKHTLASLLESVTGIDGGVLALEVPLEEVPVARRMSWAAGRETTREEDEAYALMGIFGVHMQTTYGEGRYAFIRLQEEILKRIPDQTIFAWGPSLLQHTFSFSDPSLPIPSTHPTLRVPHTPNQLLLASSVRDFSSCAGLVPLGREDFAHKLGMSPDSLYQVFTTTSYGIKARFPLLQIQTQEDPHTNVPTHIALLACEDTQGRLLALLLRPHSPEHVSTSQYHAGTIVGHIHDLLPFNSNILYSTPNSHYRRYTFIPPEDISPSLLSLRSIYIQHRPSAATARNERDEHLHAGLREARDAFTIHLTGWSRKLLSLQGYHVSPPDPSTSIALRDHKLSRTVSLSSLAGGVVISSARRYVSVQVGRCCCELGRRFGLLGVLVSARDAACALDEPFAEEPHLADNPVHVQSWTFDCGVASKEVMLVSSANEVYMLRLTFAH
ncbi:HET-domain-containing protein, partial [Epithele typhae]|uniref:HET-domain-containing protein n=1 Tax=Epithele typhae TaxID=378194 RepID=UPI0020081FD3